MQITFKDLQCVNCLPKYFSKKNFRKKHKIQNKSKTGSESMARQPDIAHQAKSSGP